MPNHQTVQATQLLIQVKNYQSYSLNHQNRFSPYISHPPTPLPFPYFIPHHAYMPFLASPTAHQFSPGYEMGDLNHTSTATATHDVKDDHQDSMPDFSEDEENLIARMFNLVGARWSLIAGRIPGRTAEEIEKYWTSKYSSSTGR